MSLHDRYARLTPFEIAFPDREAVEDLARAIAEEAGARGVDPELLGIFTTLGSVDDFVRDFLAPDASRAGGHEYGALVFHAVQFVREGCPVYLLETSAARRLVEQAPKGDPRPPGPAGYLQLPQHLFWIAPDGEGVPESVDGLFWFASGQGVLHVLPITGVRPDGPGFNAVPLPDAPLQDAPRWMDAAMRGSEDDYRSALPGHDLDGLYSVETAGEVLKLLVRFFALCESTIAPQQAGAEEVPPPGPRPSALAYTRVGSVA